MPAPVPASSLSVPAAVAGVGRVATSASALEPQIVPVAESLAPLLPLGGLRKGSVVAVRGPTSLLFALLSVATNRPGVWAAVVGRPDLGLLAAAEAGVALERLALIPRPGPDLAAVTAALLDGVDLVAMAGVQRLSTADIRRLTGRARQRGAVLLPLGDWPGADVCLDGERPEWTGLGVGHGRLRSMRLTVRASGRGAAARPRAATLTLVGQPWTTVSTLPTPSTPPTAPAPPALTALPPEALPGLVRPDLVAVDGTVLAAVNGTRPVGVGEAEQVAVGGSGPAVVDGTCPAAGNGADLAAAGEMDPPADVEVTGREDVVVPGPRVPPAGQEVVGRPQVLRSVR